MRFIGVSAARRNVRVARFGRRRRGGAPRPACAPRPSPTSCDSEFGVQIAGRRRVQERRHGVLGHVRRPAVERERLDEQHGAAGIEVLAGVRGDAHRDRPCRAGSRRSRSGRSCRRSPLPSATSNAVRPMTPASAARSRDVSIDGAWESKPAEAATPGTRSAITTTDAPWPQPTSATFAPPAELGARPRRARGSTLVASIGAVAGAEEPLGATEQARVVVAPAEAAVAPEGAL